MRPLLVLAITVWVLVQLRWKLHWLYLFLGGGSDADKIRAEKKLGDQMTRDILSRNPTLPAARLAELGQQLAARVSAGRSFEFVLLKSREVNAFAIPGGHIFVCQRLAEECGDRDSLAFVLAHEMAHVTLEHYGERLVWSWAISLFVPRYAAGLLMKGHSRENELEADRKAVELMTAAGFNRDGAERVLRLLERMNGSSETGEWLSTHPSPADRIAALED